MSHLYDRFVSLGRFAQVIGLHGVGKSTLLEHLAREMHARGDRPYLVRASRGDWPWKHGCTVLLVDEADSLQAFKRSALRTACALCGRGLLLCVHDDSGLPTLIRMEADLRTTRKVVEHLCRQWPVRVPRDEELAALLERHAGNLRLVLFTLYDWYEQGMLSMETKA